MSTISFDRETRRLDPEPMGSEETFRTKKSIVDGMFRCDDPSAHLPVRECTYRDASTPGVSTLFKAQPSNDGKSVEPAIHIDDIRQWDINDCYLMASLGAMTTSAEGRKALSNMIKENRTADGTLLSYTVKFHQPPNRTINVTVDPQLPTGALSVARSDGSGTAVETWPAIVEKAYALVKGGYHELHWGAAADVLPMLSGRVAKGLDPKAVTHVDVEQCLREGKCLVVGTAGQRNTKMPNGMLGRHAYTVVRTETRAGEPGVVLHDPRGPGHPDVFVARKDWKDVFSSMTAS